MHSPSSGTPSPSTLSHLCDSSSKKQKSTKEVQNRHRGVTMGPEETSTVGNSLFIATTLIHADPFANLSCRLHGISKQKTLPFSNSLCLQVWA